MKFLALVIFMLSLSSCSECPKAIPPGYELQVNQEGKYRPVYKDDSFPLTWFQGEGTKCEAMERAWRQYRFDEKENLKKWKTEPSGTFSPMDDLPSRGRGYDEGVNDALLTIMLHDLELSVSGEKMTWGEREKVVRQRLNVKERKP